MTLFHIALVGIGGFAGAIARFSISKALNQSTESIPIGTLAVNLLGAFLLGILTGVQSNEIILLLFGTGFLGAFTTFSTFKLEVVQIYLNKLKKKSIYYILITYSLGIVLAFLGYMIGNYL